MVARRSHRLRRDRHRLGAPAGPSVLAADPGSPRMRDIAKAIQEGAEAFLLSSVPHDSLSSWSRSRSSVPLHRDQGRVPLTLQLHPERDLARGLLPLGATFSGTHWSHGFHCGSRQRADRSGGRRGKGMPGALRVAFRTGAVTGLRASASA